MYVYFEPQGGFNDILCCVKECLEYCKKHNRILLVNGMRTCYKINFSEYFFLKEDINIILDTTQIKNICLNPEYTIYPNEFQQEMLDFLDDKVVFDYIPDSRGNYRYKNKILGFPEDDRNEDIIIIVNCGGGDGYSMFKQLNFYNFITDTFYERYNKLNKPYLCVYIRNTDHRCDYVTFFGQHEQQIRSFNEIYIATDDVNAIKFYINNGLQVKNFTTFPEKEEYSLHTSSINSHTKFIDMLCDLLIISRSHTIMSNSKGCYILLARAIKNGYWSW